MKNTSNQFDVIIIGGNYSGLSAAMALGRSFGKILFLMQLKFSNIGHISQIFLSNLSSLERISAIVFFPLIEICPTIL
ncbi:hypothetical protein SAMN05444408_10464 [Chryseobacterium takakiae]|uniref:Pyridine nucleotide-disulphide oxidoreductase n=1 Tax=Chryseobacterium takakiae TaxID=1302685 RepID=A0A1M4W902_9FLAO|nr:hypothetical protein SAMN05444408_10464 [Chryseobacterium takakiae]